jgi:hypothetical protein
MKWHEFLVLAGGITGLVTTGLGAHIYRWEIIVWQALVLILLVTVVAYRRAADD